MAREHNGRLCVLETGTRDFLKNVYFCDVRHPSALGHKMIGSSVLARVQYELRMDPQPRWLSVENDASALAPIAVSSAEANMFDDDAAVATRLDFRKHDVKKFLEHQMPSPLGAEFDVQPGTVVNVRMASKGFQWGEDVPGKPGLLAYQAGQ